MGSPHDPIGTTKPAMLHKILTVLTGLGPICKLLTPLSPSRVMVSPWAHLELNLCHGQWPSNSV